MDQILGQERATNQELSRSAAVTGAPRLRRGDLNRALRARGVTANERKVVEYLAPRLSRGARDITQRAIIAATGATKDGVTRGLRNAIRHGFLVRDESTRPHTLALHPDWIEPADAERR